MRAVVVLVCGLLVAGCTVGALTSPTVSESHAHALQR
jgi:hypothetical protein